MLVPGSELLRLLGIGPAELEGAAEACERALRSTMACGGAAEADEVEEEGGLQGQCQGRRDLRQPPQRVAGGGEAAPPPDRRREPGGGPPQRQDCRVREGRG